MGNIFGNLVYFNSRKDAGKFNQFIWSIIGNDLHVYQGERELPEDSYVYQQIKCLLGMKKAS